MSKISYLFCTNKELFSEIQKTLGFSPGNIQLYEEAFTHRSVARIIDGRKFNNERLEFLGDAILDAIIGEYLYHVFPYEDEGFLTQMRSKLVQGDKLCELTQQIGLDKLIISNTKAGSGGNKKIFEDAFEALIGAIYLDKGFCQTRNFIIKYVVQKHIDLKRLMAVDNNYKSQLIEWAQKHKYQIQFETQTETDENNNFESKVIVNKENYGIGKGLSKKAAEQDAAKTALERIEIEEEYLG